MTANPKSPILYNNSPLFYFLIKILSGLISLCTTLLLDINSIPRAIWYNISTASIYGNAPLLLIIYYKLPSGQN